MALTIDPYQRKCYQKGRTKRQVVEEAISLKKGMPQ